MNESPAPDRGPALPEDMRVKLRAAAESLAGLAGGDVTVAEEAVLQSALELLRDATVTRYAPVLAERRARQRLRDGGT